MISQEPALALPEPLLAGSTSIHVRAGDVVFRRGDPVHGVYLVERGAVRLLRHGSDGEEVVLHEARAGELFAEASVDAAHYHCDAVVTSAGRLVCLPIEPLRRLLATDAPFAGRWAALLAAQLRAARMRVERLTLRTAAQRVRHLLVTEGSGAACELEIQGTVKDLAARLGLSHEALYRTLSTLERDGIIERLGARIRFRRRSSI